MNPGADGRAARSGADNREPDACVQTDTANKRAAGVDDLDIDQTARHLVMAWPAIRERH